MNLSKFKMPLKRCIVEREMETLIKYVMETKCTSSFQRMAGVHDGNDDQLSKEGKLDKEAGM